MTSSDLVNFIKLRIHWKGQSVDQGLQGTVGVQRKHATFQSAMKFLLIIGQSFGFIPVAGACELDASKLRFKIISWRCVYTLVSLIGYTWITSLLFLNLFKDYAGSSIETISHLIFYIFNTITIILFLRVATKWPQLCVYIAKSEAMDPITDTHPIRSCNMYCFFICALAILENSLAKLYLIVTAQDCKPESNSYEVATLYNFPWMYDYIPYNHFVGFILHFLDIQFTFSRHYVDLFILCLSIYLTSRFEEVNKRVVAAKDRHTTSSNWRQIRENYNRVGKLVAKVDSVIGELIFVSFAANLYFICLQLMYILVRGMHRVPGCRIEDGPDQRPLHGYEMPVYFVYSSILLMFRSLTASLAAARVNAASRVPLHALYEVSAADYCLEVERFEEQIIGDGATLTALQFFNVNRGLILVIAGTIVTYELVLMQFNWIKPVSAATI